MNVRDMEVLRAPEGTWVDCDILYLDVGVHFTIVCEAVHLCFITLLCAHFISQ